MEVKIWGISQKKQSFKRRLTKVFCKPHPHPERKPLVSDLSQFAPCFLLGCHHEPGELTRCYVLSASRKCTVQTKMCSSAKDNWLQTSLTAEANWPRQQPGSKAGMIRAFRKAKKSLDCWNPCPTFPQLTQVDMTVIHKGTTQMSRFWITS